MSNQRVSQLAQVSGVSLNSNDLFYIVDVSNPLGAQSKAVTLGTVSGYISTNAASGSFYGTSSWATNSQTASYVAVQPTSSYAITASYALNGGSGGTTTSASWASSSLSSSFSITASYANISNATSASYATNALNSGTSSYVAYYNNNNGTIYNSINSITSQYAVNASSASIAETALNTITATNALTATSASYTPYSDYAATAGFAQTAQIGITTNYQSSASFASSSISASFAFNSNIAYSAISASYAAPSMPQNKHGVYAALSQSVSSSQIDSINLDPEFSVYGNPANFTVQAHGTVIVPYTSSLLTNESVTLNLFDRLGGITYTLDSSPIYFNMGNTTSTVTGSIKIPFSLVGEISAVSSSYMAYVTASRLNTSISLDTSRLVKFNVDTNIGQFNVSTGDQMVLKTTVPSDVLVFSSSFGGGYVSSTSASALVAAGSSSFITYLDISALTNTIQYVWTLNNLNYLYSYSNNFTTLLDGMPASLVTMSLQNGILTSIRSLQYTSASILRVNNNLLTSLPTLPPSMSIIDCSRNPLTTLPSTLPSGLTSFTCNATSITTPPSVSFPSALISMSFNNNPNLSSWLTPLPSALQYIDISNCPSLTTLPINTTGNNIIYFNAYGCSFSADLENVICLALYNGGYSNGYLNLSGLTNAPLYSTTILNYVATLQSRGWTVYHN